MNIINFDNISDSYERFSDKISNKIDDMNPVRKKERMRDYMLGIGVFSGIQGWLTANYEMAVLGTLLAGISKFFLWYGTPVERKYLNMRFEGEKT